MTKRTVSTDALETLGTIIDEKQKRDAIHIAVLPVIAAERLLPGQDVSVMDGEAFRLGAHVGIVDPFLKTHVEPGQIFWLLLYPRMVTSLRHVWTHPAFADDDASAVATKPAEEEPEGPSPYRLVASWATIDRYAKQAGMDRDGLMDATKSYKQRGAWVTLDHSSFDGLGDDFWTAYDEVTGEETPESERENFFSCNC
jgi:hypothetical protein